MPSRTAILSLLVTILACVSLSHAFAPTSQLSNVNVNKSTATRMNMGFGMGDGDEPKTLTRENEPEEYFSTNLDKMSDADKIPIAIGGFLFISLPFVAGMIALYASK
jgi:hypothetical protein